MDVPTDLHNTVYKKRNSITAFHKSTEIHTLSTRWPSCRCVHVSSRGQQYHEAAAALVEGGGLRLLMLPLLVVDAEEASPRLLHLKGRRREHQRLPVTAVRRRLLPLAEASGFTYRGRISL